MQGLLGDEFEDYLRCYEEKRWYGLRVNTSKISVKQFRKICPFPIEPIPWIENGFYYDGDQVQAAKHPYYFAGLYYLQEPSAMTPANRLMAEPGDRVLDLCAAPGGKATELGARLDGSGLLVANDISASRAKGLLKNIEVFGIRNALVVNEDPGKLEAHFPEYFDKILIDAPCSGEGMFRKDRKMVKAWEEHGPAFFSGIQKNIVCRAARMLKPGGLMLYSTCTFDPMENEETIAHLLRQFPEFVIRDIRPYDGFACGKPEAVRPQNRDLEKTVRIWPHRMHGEGHYLALLQKGAGAECVKRQEPDQKPAGRTRKIPAEMLEFFEDLAWEMDWSRLQLCGERAYYMPDTFPNLTGLRLLRTGLYLGDLKKNRFEPSQSLAMCLKKGDYAHTIRLPLADERVIRYLKGETVEADDLADGKSKGWQLVLVDDYPLGWGKLAGGVLKNKYLPGWRWQS